MESSLANSFKVHLASRQNVHRTACGRSIFTSVFLVQATERVTCERCRRRIEAERAEHQVLVDEALESARAKLREAGREAVAERDARATLELGVGTGGFWGFPIGAD